VAETTLEEAARCPWCAEPGKKTGTTQPHGQGIERGVKVETYECENTRCENEGERWLVQFNPDGTIPPKGTRNEQPKEYDIMRHTTFQERERAKEAMRRQYEESIVPGSS
jgi:hypothetical protein